MAWTFKFKKKADKEFSKLPFTTQQRISRYFKDHAHRHPHEYSIYMSGNSGCSRVRVGDYRIIIDIDDLQQCITIIKVAHRKDIYRP